MIAPTGAFKVRGGLFYLDRLLRKGKKPGYQVPHR